MEKHELAARLRASTGKHDDVAAIQQHTIDALRERLATAEQLLRDSLRDPGGLMSHLYAPWEPPPGHVRSEWDADIDRTKPHRPGCLRCRAEVLVGKTPSASERYIDALAPTTEKPHE